MAITDAPEALRAPALPEVLTPSELPLDPFLDTQFDPITTPEPAQQPHEVSDYYWRWSDVASILRTDTLPLLKRTAGQALGYIGCAAAAGISSLMYFPAHTHVGPHEANVTLNSDPYITAD